MRKALDTWQRYINERAGREWDFEGPGMPVMAQVRQRCTPSDHVRRLFHAGVTFWYAHASACVVQLHEETEPIPPEYITQVR